MSSPDKPSAAGRKLLYFFASLLGALAITWLLAEPEMTWAQIIVLFVVFFSSGLWATEAGPPYGVALMVMALLVFSLGYRGLTARPAEIKVFTDTFSSSVIWLLLGGFCIASSISKTGLDAVMIRFSLKVFGSSPRRVLFGMMGVTMIGSMFLSNTATTAMVMAALAPLMTTHGKRSPLIKAMVLGIPIAATFGGLGMLIGTPANVIAAQEIVKAGGYMSFVEWLFYGFPVMLFLTSLCAWLLARHFFKNMPVNQKALNIHVEPSKATLTDKTIVIAVLLVTMGMWVTSSIHGLSAAAVSAIPLVVLSLTGILNSTDVKSLGWDTLILIAGGLAIGEGLRVSGLVELYGARFAAIHLSPLLVMLSLAYIVTLLTNVLGAVATSAIFIPFGISIVPDNIVAISMVIGLCSSICVLLPVSSPPNAIAYSTEIIEQKDFLVAGKVLVLAGPAFIVFWVWLLTM
jgi:sodium-dependent dicarboxylate transporter 2/3/5